MKRKFAILMALISLICVFNINSFAASDLIMDCKDVTNLGKFLEDKYGLVYSNDLTSSDWACPIYERDPITNKRVEKAPAGKPYKVIVQFPVKRVCYLINGERNARYPCDADEVDVNGIIGTINETPSWDDAITHRTTITAWISGATTIYSNRQLEMSDVDINIMDGKVVITGVEASDENAWNMIYQKYKVFINGFTGICVLTCVLVFIISSIKLGSVAGNPRERKSCMTAMLLSGIGTAALGAIIIIFSFFMNLL